MPAELATPGSDDQAGAEAEVAWLPGVVPPIADGETADTHEAGDAPEAADADETADAREVAAAHDAADIREATDAPEAADVPEAADAPEATATHEAADAPEPADVREVADVHEPAEAPEAEDAPEAGEHPGLAPDADGPQLLVPGPLDPPAANVAAIDGDPLADVEAVADDEEEPATASVSNGLKHILLGILGMVVLIIAIRLLAPHVGFLADTWEKVRKGDPVWLVLGVILETFSFAGYVWVFNATATRAGLRLPRVTSWRITLAGVAATRLIATAGAGGIAATTFALRRHGLDARAAAATVTAQLAIVYGWFIFLIFVTGMALFVGGHGHAAITIVPAAIAAGILLTAAGGRSVIRKLANVSAQREGRVAEAVAVIPGTLDDAVATVVTLIRERNAAIIGGALWWLADAGVLWAACHAFGASPNMLDVMMAYLLGQTANLLPIPGGLGVEAGLLGMLIAFGVPGGVAVLASLVQRLISTWLPALPGALALASIGHASPDAEVIPVDDDPPPPGPSAAAA